MSILADTPTLWDRLHNLVHDEVDMDSFLATKGDAERMCVIERAAQKPPPQVDNKTLGTVLVFCM
jgi:phosphomannomutase